MRDVVPISVGAAASGLILREHTMRSRAERLSAATMETLLNTIDANDAVTGDHVRRVADYAFILGEAAGLDERTQHSVERVALFHDIGKLHGALTDIFHESSKLTPEERRAVMTHPLRGAEVLAPLSAFYPELAKGVAAHAVSRQQRFRSRRALSQSPTVSTRSRIAGGTVTRAASTLP